MSRRRRGSAELGRAGSRSLEHRIGNAIFYVVAEGNTEYDYLNWLNTTYGSTLKFFIRMPQSAGRKNGLPPSRVAEHARRLSDEPAIKQVWGLFDHDGRVDIDQVCLREKSDRVSLVLSHPSFELWLLLHLREFAPGDRQYGENELVMDKLRDAHQTFANYGKRIDAARFTALTECNGVHNAVRRARSLSRHFARETPSQRDPSTEMYLLIEALGIAPRAS